MPVVYAGGAPVYRGRKATSAVLHALLRGRDTGEPEEGLRHHLRQSKVLRREGDQVHGTVQNIGIFQLLYH